MPSGAEYYATHRENQLLHLEPPVLWINLAFSERQLFDRIENGDASANALVICDRLAEELHPGIQIVEHSWLGEIYFLKGRIVPGTEAWNRYMRTHPEDLMAYETTRMNQLAASQSYHRAVVLTNIEMRSISLVDNPDMLPELGGVITVSADDPRIAPASLVETRADYARRRLDEPPSLARVVLGAFVEHPAPVRKIRDGVIVIEEDPKIKPRKDDW